MDQFAIPCPSMSSVVDHHPIPHPPVNSSPDLPPLSPQRGLGQHIQRASEKAGKGAAGELRGGWRKKKKKKGGEGEANVREREGGLTEVTRSKREEPIHGHYPFFLTWQPSYTSCHFFLALQILFFGLPLFDLFV